MDIFRVRNHLIEDYRDFTGSFVDIQDKKIAAHVADRMGNGYQWPDPWLSLNPSFASGGTVTELVQAGLLQPECERIFRLKEKGPDGPVLRLHLHQREAIEAARTGDSYVLTTGTGSGKSLAYIVPIVDRVLAAKAAGTNRPGIKAIVVYPMNALANSQVRELAKFLQVGYPEGQPPVTFARYTGQESADRRAEIIANPPDILLTNYVMLELVLTRPRERRLIEAARGLWFLVLDELHTYRGRQGADVALLVRRLREICAAPQAGRDQRGHAAWSAPGLASAAPSGRTPGTLAEIVALLDAAVSRQLGRPVQTMPALSFSTETGTAMLRREFSSVTLRAQHVSLAIPGAQPVIAYVDSIREPTLALIGEPLDFDAVLGDIGAEVERAIHARGSFRTTSHSGVFFCR